MINPELVEKFASGEGVFFVGAGLSIGGGLRSWDELMRPLREDLRAVRTIAGRPTDDLDYLSYLGLAQAYEAEVNRMRLIEQLRSSLPRDGGSPTEVHMALFKFPVREIYTTNFDEFLEMAARKQQRNYLTVIRPSDADDTPKSPANGAPAVRIVKIHGDYDDKESIVITEEDYRLARERKGKIWADMDHMFRTKTVLFLGYSFNDPDLQHLIKEVRDKAGRFPRSAYSILLGDNPAERERLRDIGIQAIPLQKNRRQTINEALADWLKEFMESVADQSRIAAPVQPVQHNLPPPRPLIGRDAELRGLLSMLEWEGNCVPLCGEAGVGKTNLALATAHHCAESGRLFKYVIWISARGRKPADLLTDLLTAVERTTGYSLGVPDPGRLPPERRDRFFAVAMNHPMLIVIDHLDMQQKKHLKQIIDVDLGASCILVTTEAAYFRGGAILEGLSGPDAINFLTALIRAGPSAHPLVQADDRSLVDFAEALHGNPMLLNLAFHLAGSGICIRDLARECNGKGVVALSSLLHGKIWELLDADSQIVLLITREFASGSIHATALKNVSQMDSRTFWSAIDNCRAYGLLEVENIEQRELARIRVHPTTIEFMSGIKDPSVNVPPARALRSRIIEYYLDLVTRCAKRRRPEPRYWNALVSDSMRELDLEWANIRLSAKWASEEYSEKYLEFPMLLIHYMDSRLYNTDRILGVRHALAVLLNNQDWEGVALMHLDALAWTHMEQNRLSDARIEVDKGLEFAGRLAPGKARDDLEALGIAWRSRLALEQDPEEPDKLTSAELELQHSKQWKEAGRIADEGLKFIDQADRDISPWIRVRVLMIAGDAALRLGNGEEALGRYDEALKLSADAYNYEGNGYELLPRIGLACISIRKLDRAKATFSELAGAVDIPVARLYGELGLGLADYQQQNTAEARKRVEDAASELRDRKARMLLLRAFEQQYEAQRQEHMKRLNIWYKLGEPPLQPVPDAQAIRDSFARQ